MSEPKDQHIGSEQQSNPEVGLDDLSKPSNVTQQIDNMIQEEQKITQAKIELEEVDPIIVQDAAINLQSSSTDKNFIYPLKTKKIELQSFFNDYNFEKYQASVPFKKFLADNLLQCTAPNTSDSGDLKSKLKLMVQSISSIEKLILRMPFDLYWDFRNYQMQNFKDQLEHLNLDEDETTDELQQAKWKIFNKKFPSNQPFTTANFNKRKQYYRNLKKLYAGVSIDEVKDKDGNKLENTRAINKNSKTLVTITSE